MQSIDRTVTVGQLILLLQQFPKELEVKAQENPYSRFGISTVTKTEDREGNTVVILLPEE